ADRRVLRDQLHDALCVLGELAPLDGLERRRRIAQRVGHGDADGARAEVEPQQLAGAGQGGERVGRFGQCRAFVWAVALATFGPLAWGRRQGNRPASASPLLPAASRKHWISPRRIATCGGNRLAWSMPCRSTPPPSSESEALR